MWSIDDAFKYLYDQIKDGLRDAMTNFQHLSRPAKRARLYFEALFRLDTALSTATESTVHAVALSLGCLVITSPEFRSLVSQSARLLAEGHDGSISVDLVAGLVAVHPHRHKFPGGVSCRHG